jgi:hypothetical protein
MKTLLVHGFIASSALLGALALAAPPGQQSTIEGYRAFADPEPKDWRKANAEVEQIGGWLTYTRQSQAELKAERTKMRAAQSSASGGAPQPAPKAEPAADPHAGHNQTPAGQK